MHAVLKDIQVSSILLDKNNPRLKFSKIEKGLKNWTDKEIEETIKESIPFNRLLDSIKEYGVIDPIWLYEVGKDVYEVVEGNMRVTVLRTLVRNNTESPSGIKYDVVRAH